MTPQRGADRSPELRPAAPETHVGHAQCTQQALRDTLKAHVQRGGNPILLACPSIQDHPPPTHLHNTPLANIEMVDVWDHDMAACEMGHCPECIAQLHFHERIAPRLARERAGIAIALAIEEHRRRVREERRKRVGKIVRDVEGVLGWLGLEVKFAASAGESAKEAELADEKAP